MKEKMNSKYTVGMDEEDGLVYLCYDTDKPCNYLSSFLAVWVDDKGAKSPFKNFAQVKAFVEMVKNLLEGLYDFK